MKSILLYVLLAAAAVSLSACGKDASSNVSSPTPTSTSVAAVDAQMTYKNFCISCHGGNLEGFEGPNLQKVGERLSEEQIIKQIKKGSAGMPGFVVSIPDQDIQALAKWLAAKK
jgi:cytochrome c551